MKANKITIQPVPLSDLTWHFLVCWLWIYRLWLWKVSLTLKPSPNSITEVLSNYNLTQSRVIHPSIDIECYEVYSSLLYPLSQSEAEMLSMEHCPLRRRCSLCPIHHELICLSGGLLFSLSGGIYSEESGWICATWRRELRKLSSRLFKRAATNYLHTVILWTCQLNRCWV